MTLDELWAQIQKSCVESCCPDCLGPMEFEMGLSVLLGPTPTLVDLDADGDRGVERWWCPNCNQHVEPLQCDALADARAMRDRVRLPREHCGLNADWSSRAWAVTGDLRTDRSVFILDDEDPDGSERTYSLVQRIFRDGDNDQVVTLRSRMTEAEAAECLRSARPTPPAAPRAPAHDDCEDAEARAFCDMDPEDLQRELEKIAETYGLWVRMAAGYGPKEAQRMRENMRRVMRRLMGLAFRDRRYTPRVGDKVVTLKGDNDCDGNDKPRQALPGATGKVTDVDEDGDRYHVVFDESEVWVSLELYEICDPEQYTWEP